MLLNDKNTIKQGFNYLSSDPIMNFFIKNFGDEIDALDRYDDNFAIALCNLIIEQQISFKAAITIKKKFANLIKSFSNKEIIKLDNDTIKSIGLSYRKVSYIKNILRFFEDEKIEFNKLNDDPDNFYKAKIASGNYYMTKILPETGSLMSSIMSGAKYYNDYNDNFFDLSFKL